MVGIIYVKHLGLGS